MSASYLRNNNFESVHSSQLHPPRRATAIPPATVSSPVPQPIITDVAQLENYDPAITNRVAAALLGMEPGTLKKMRRRQQGPDYFKTESGAVRYLLSAVLDYRARRTVKH
jgi:hypothetical protein